MLIGQVITRCVFVYIVLHGLISYFPKVRSTEQIKSDKASSLVNFQFFVLIVASFWKTDSMNRSTEKP